MPPLLIASVLVMIAYCFVTSVVSVLASRIYLELQRHDLLVRSKVLRLEYLNSIAEMKAGVEEELDEVI